jgi:hypothetical protein
LPEKEHKSRKKIVVKKNQKGTKIVDRVAKIKSGKKMPLKNKTGKKENKKGNKKLNKSKKDRLKDVLLFEDIKRNVENKQIQENKPADVIEKVVLTQDTQINQDPILPMVRFGSLIPFASKRNYYTIISFLFILMFFVGGYIYPATSEDIASNNVIWAGNEGKYDRGLFSQFYASIAFTMGVFLLGYYVNATFIRYNIKDWNYFSIGILLMLFFGLGRIGELVYDHNIFEGFKNIVLPVALIVLAFASYKIYKNMAEAI